MLVRAAFALMQLSPWFKRFIWKRWYQFIAGYGNAEWGFMNYGYVELSSPATSLPLKPEDEPNRFSIQLYHCVATAVAVQGLRVLEVGSGRGGGASYVARYLQPAQMTGVDYSAKAVQLCKKRYDIPGLEFVQGDAEALPLAAGSFDVVLNVESSHCYGSMPKFVAEVQRVLKPGGYFSFVDFREVADLEKLHSALVAGDWELVQQEEITPQVLEALRLDSERKKALIEKAIGKSLMPTFAQFAGIEGSETYEKFRTRQYVYVRYLMRKRG